MLYEIEKFPSWVGMPKLFDKALVRNYVYNSKDTWHATRG